MTNIKLAVTSPAGRPRSAVDSGAVGNGAVDSGPWDALARVVTSSGFRRAPRLAAFLRYIVERELAGHRSQIKGYTIAVEALGRHAEFDPQADPIVRVEAGRLRRALKRYYAGPGRRDPLVIEVPPGKYVPLFRARDGAVDDAQVSEPTLEREVAVLHAGQTRQSLTRCHHEVATLLLRARQLHAEVAVSHKIIGDSIAVLNSSREQRRLRERS